jgi:hypothetical protein
MAEVTAVSLLALHQALWATGQQGYERIFRSNPDSLGWDQMLVEGLPYIDFASIPNAKLPSSATKMVVRPVYEQIYEEISRKALAKTIKRGWVAYISGQPGIGM